MKYEEIELTDNKEERRFELWIDNICSFIEYRLKNDKIFLIHTIVPEEQEGKGIASALVEKAFRLIESRGLKVIPRCSYVQSFLKRHPEWNGLVASPED